MKQWKDCRVMGVDPAGAPDASAMLVVRAEGWVGSVEIDFTVDFTVEDRTALSAITVCCMCGKPINPESQAEYDASESLGVHVGNCFHALKRESARMGKREPFSLLDDEPIDQVTYTALERLRGRL